MRSASARQITVVPVAVVGAGPAGLAVSNGLARAGVRHLVLERGEIGSTWRTQRWDSFRLNTPVWATRVPGDLLAGAPGSFATAHALVAGLERLAEGLPVVEGVEVVGARPLANGWRLETSRGTVVAKAVVAASGFQNVPRRPGYAAALPATVRQLHVADYRRPRDVEGDVLVVGGGQSGVQIAEDLLRGGRRVYIATSTVGRLPRRHRGRDAFEWLRATGQLDFPSADADRSMITATPPQVSSRTISYQELARRGATLLGRVVGWDGRRLQLTRDVGENVRFADGVARAFRDGWDEYARRHGADTYPFEPLEAADEPGCDLYAARGPASLDPAAAGISTVIWATGFDASTDWLPAGALDSLGRSRLPRLHVIGAPWLTHRSSANLYGIATDAAALARTLAGTADAAALHDARLSRQRRLAAQVTRAR